MLQEENKKELDLFDVAKEQLIKESIESAKIMVGATVIAFVITVWKKWKQK